MKNEREVRRLDRPTASSAGLDSCGARAERCERCSSVIFEETRSMNETGADLRFAGWQRSNLAPAQPWITVLPSLLAHADDVIE
jgi:hypothetical protein